MTSRKIVLPLTAFITAAICIICNCKSECVLHNQMEGFHKDALRVYVRHYIPGDDSDKKINRNIRDVVQEKGKKRAFILLENYIKTSFVDRKTIDVAMKKIANSIKMGKIICTHCDDEYCHAFVDFNIKELMVYLRQKKL